MDKPALGDTHLTCHDFTDSQILILRLQSATVRNSGELQILD